jgi:FixJ family two-component response regulator
VVKNRISGIEGKGIIHLVDDDKEIVTISTKALTHNGYQVHAFTRPSEAIVDIETKCRTGVWMLITDLRMPEHSGFEIARRTREIVPDVPIVFMTGFEISTQEFDALFPSLHVNAFLQKPFQIDELLKVVKKYEDRSCMTHSKTKEQTI